MKRRWIYAALGLMVTATVFSSAAISVTADETEETTAAESESETAEETVLTFDVDGTEISVTNKTGEEITSVTAEAAEAADEEETEDAEASETAAYTVTVSAAEGDHSFENADPAAWTDAELVEENGFFYVQYTAADGSEAEAVETADAVTPEETLTMWTTSKLNVREEPDTEAEVLTVAELGGECEVVSILPGWYEVKYGDTEGYVSHKYLSDDKEEVDALVAAAEEAAAAAAAASADSYSYSSGSGSSGSSSSSSSSSSSQSAAQCLDNGLLN